MSSTEQARWFADTFDKLVNWVIGIFLGAGAVAILAALGLSVTASC